MATALTCSVVLETAVERSQHTQVCAQLSMENQLLAERIDAYRFDSNERMGALAMLLSKEVIENQRLREELEDARRQRKYEEISQVDLVKEPKARGDGNHVSSRWSSLVNNGLHSAAELWQGVKRTWWIVRYRIALAVRSIRKGLRIPLGCKLYKELIWLEKVVMGPVE